MSLLFQILFENDVKMYGTQTDAHEQYKRQLQGA